MQNNIVIFGGNRGIGLELVKQYLTQENNIVVICRHSSKELESLGVKVISGKDVTDDAAMAKINEELDIDKIDVFIHNAGVLVPDSFPEIDLEVMRKSFEINTLGPLKTILALKDKFKAGSKIGILSSRVGSIADNSSSNNYAYRVSKTAVNMLGTCLALDFKKSKVALALLHPGYVKTEMTAGQGFIEADEAAVGLKEQMDQLSMENTGLFVHSNGEKLPW
ncbi:MAG: SDR family oxidoreductase [Bacteriovoracaceae bacterium]|jgi:NAD(P)-dependent dehydrogenase (short-subunit alcohol dehydrogenase family)|nr:short-chain dehydrogenase [Halobacteriovoraceae bacterium]MDP7320764.1 SDR family oxidoreductase [Bacteriovoracaceae bacterium]|tara:strand:- start:13 stop:678 length:666 start_codon:yes stop_codon:yes gene_type:complete